MWTSPACRLMTLGKPDFRTARSRVCPQARPGAWDRPVKLSGVADAPVGIFDSGFGGLTVARAVLDQLPHEPILYLGDTARQPYGPKPIAEVESSVS